MRSAIICSLVAVAALALASRGPLLALDDVVEPPDGRAESAILGNAAAVDSAADLGIDAGVTTIAPTWTFRGGVLVLTRQSDPSRLLTIGQLAPSLDAADFATATRGGLDIGFVHHGSIFDVETRYFEIDSLTGNAGPLTGVSTFIVSPYQVVQFVGPPVPFSPYISAGSPNLTLDAVEYTQLHSYEVNVRRGVLPYVTVVAGYRHIDLTDRIFAQTSTSGVVGDNFSVQAFNHLDGFQLGGEAVLWRPGAGRFRLEGSAKVGVFGDATSNFGNFDNLRATASAAHAALMTEWSVTAVYQITPQIAARVGYQGLLLDGVALASEQIGVLNPAAHTGAVENSGTPIYQGLVANLEYAW
jgi:hypothetical protein